MKPLLGSGFLGPPPPPPETLFLGVIEIFFLPVKRPLREKSSVIRKFIFMKKVKGRRKITQKRTITIKMQIPIIIVITHPPNPSNNSEESRDNVIF
jgi:hypothetical protein